jgi:opacity protein-like surface antigen
LDGDTEAEIEVGGRLSLAGGYHITEWMAVEGETGFFSNYLDRFRDADDVDINDSRLTRIPFMGNVVFEVPNRSRWTPFAGVGVGVSFSSFLADDITDHTTYVVDDTDTDAVLAYQGFVGMRFQINERMSLGLTYQYFASEEARWDLDTFLVQGDTRIKMDAQRTHAVTGVFKMTF